MASPDDEGDPADVAVPVDDPAGLAACTPEPLRPGGFNPGCVILYGCTVEHVRRTMQEFQGFLGFINGQLNSKNILRFEAMLSPANFSSMVGEFAVSTLPKHCPALVKNGYHNGHPDLLPAGMFAGDSLHHGTEGIEVKGSRYTSGWQGHNKEECWLMVFVFDSNRPADAAKGTPPRPFAFRQVLLGRLTKDDWSFSGRSEGSRRTITASVTPTGYAKMSGNWLYRHDAGVEKPPKVKPPRRGKPLA